MILFRTIKQELRPQMTYKPLLSRTEYDENGDIVVRDSDGDVSMRIIPMNPKPLFWRPDYVIDWNHKYGAVVRDGDGNIVAKNLMISEKDAKRIINKIKMSRVIN